MPRGAILKIVAGVTCMLFTMSTIALAVPDMVYRVHVPEEHGKVTERWKSRIAQSARLPKAHGGQAKRTAKDEKNALRSAPSALQDQDRIVILLQDAHDNFGAQQNIAEIIRTLIPQFDDEEAIFGVEGAIDEIDVEPYRKYPIHEARTQASETLMRQGYLTGTEHAAISSPEAIPLWGVEDKELFRKDFKCFQEVAKQRDVIEQYLNQIDSIITELKAKIYNSELRNCDTQWRLYSTEHLSFDDYICHIEAYCQRLDIELVRNPQYLLFQEIVRLDARINQAKLKQTVAALLEQLTEVDGFDLQELATMNPEEIVRDFYALSYLWNSAQMVAHRFNRHAHPNIVKKLELYRKMALLNAADLAREIAAITSDIMKAVATSKAERTLITYDKELQILRKILTLRGTSEDVQHIFCAGNEDVLNCLAVELARLRKRYSVTQPLPANTEHIHALFNSVQRFYELAEAREAAMLDNLLSKMQAEDKHYGVLVAGGYHTAGITQLLKAKNISYVSITPHITDVADTTGYIDRMLGNLVTFSPHVTSYIHVSRINILLDALHDIADQEIASQLIAKRRFLPEWLEYFIDDDGTVDRTATARLELLAHFVDDRDVKKVIGGIRELAQKLARTVIAEKGVFAPMEELQEAIEMRMHEETTRQQLERLIFPDAVPRYLTPEIPKGKWRDMLKKLDGPIVDISMESHLLEMGYFATAMGKGGLGILESDTGEGYFKEGVKAFLMLPMYEKMVVPVTDPKHSASVRHKRQILEHEITLYDRRIVDVHNKVNIRTFMDNPEQLHFPELDVNKEKPIKMLTEAVTDEFVVKKEKQVKIAVDLWDRNRFRSHDVAIFVTSRGGTPAFLFACEEINDMLYSGDTARRLNQQVLMGKAAPKLMERLGIKPSVVRLNEAHTVVAMTEMQRNKNFEDVIYAFTNHTPIEAGMARYEDPEWFGRLGLPAEYRDIFIKNGKLDFSFAAMMQADIVNGVSKRHAEILKEMFPDFEDKIHGVMNGTGEDWVSDHIKQLTAARKRLSARDLWDAHQKDKQKLKDIIEVRARGREFKMDEPVAMAIRRIDHYKQQQPMLKDIIRALCQDKGVKTKVWIDGKEEELEGLGMTIILGGIMVDPFDDDLQDWVKDFLEWMDDPSLKGRFIFISGNDVDLMKAAAAGCDAWIEMPRPDEEACGTSGMRAATNGNMPIGFEGGWAQEWIREYQPKREGETVGFGNGFMLESFVDPADGFRKCVPMSLYEKLSTVSDLYYRWRVKEMHEQAEKMAGDEQWQARLRAWNTKIEHWDYTGEGDEEWIELRKKVHEEAQALDIGHMVKRYVSEIFLPAKIAKEISWTGDVRPTTAKVHEITLGEEFEVSGVLKLRSGRTFLKDIQAEICWSGGDWEAQPITMPHVKRVGLQSFEFKGTIKPTESGEYGYKVRFTIPSVGKVYWEPDGFGNEGIFRVVEKQGVSPPPASDNLPQLEGDDGGEDGSVSTIGRRNNRDGFMRGGGEISAQAFRENINTKEYKDEPTNDMTVEFKAEFLAVITTLLQEIVKHDDIPHHIREIIEDEALEHINDIRVYKFKSIMIEPDDFVLAEYDHVNKHLFLATDLMEKFRKNVPQWLREKHGPDTLVHEYILHELICPLIGHCPAIELLQYIFMDHYPDKTALSQQTLEKPYKGVLGEVVRNIINWEVTSFAPAEVKDLAEILAVHERTYPENHIFHCAPETMKKFIEAERVFIMRVSNEIRSVLLTHPLATEGTIAAVSLPELWENMLRAEMPQGDIDTLLLWSIAIHKDEFTAEIPMEKLFMEHARYFFNNVPYLMSFCPVNHTFKKFVEDLQQKGIRKQIIDKYGIYLYLASLERYGALPYLRELDKEYIAPHKFFKNRQKRREEIAEIAHYLHAWEKNALPIQVIPFKKLYAPNERQLQVPLYSVLYGVKGFTQEDPGFHSLAADDMRYELLDILEAAGSLQNKQLAAYAEFINTLMQKIRRRSEDMERAQRVLSALYNQIITIPDSEIRINCAVELVLRLKTEEDAVAFLNKWLHEEDHKTVRSVLHFGTMQKLLMRFVHQIRNPVTMIGLIRIISKKIPGTESDIIPIIQTLRKVETAVNEAQAFLDYANRKTTDRVLFNASYPAARRFYAVFKDLRTLTRKQSPLRIFLQELKKEYTTCGAESLYPLLESRDELQRDLESIRDEDVDNVVTALIAEINEDRSVTAIFNGLVYNMISKEYSDKLVSEMDRILAKLVKVPHIQDMLKSLFMAVEIVNDVNAINRHLDELALLAGQRIFIHRIHQRPASDETIEIVVGDRVTVEIDIDVPFADVEEVEGQLEVEIWLYDVATDNHIAIPVTSGITDIRYEKPTMWYTFEGEIETDISDKSIISAPGEKFFIIRARLGADAPWFHTTEREPSYANPDGNTRLIVKRRKDEDIRQYIGPVTRPKRIRAQRNVSVPLINLFQEWKKTARREIPKGALVTLSDEYGKVINLLHERKIDGGVPAAPELVWHTVIMTLMRARPREERMLAMATAYHVLVERVPFVKLIPYLERKMWGRKLLHDKEFMDIITGEKTAYDSLSIGEQIRLIRSLARNFNLDYHALLNTIYRGKSIYGLRTAWKASVPLSEAHIDVVEGLITKTSNRFFTMFRDFKQRRGLFLITLDGQGDSIPDRILRIPFDLIDRAAQGDLDAFGALEERIMAYGLWYESPSARAVARDASIALKVQIERYMKDLLHASIQARKGAKMSEEERAAVDQRDALWHDLGRLTALLHDADENKVVLPFIEEVYWQWLFKSIPLRLTERDPESKLKDDLLHTFQELADITQESEKFKSIAELFWETAQQQGGMDLLWKIFAQPLRIMKKFYDKQDITAALSSNVYAAIDQVMQAETGTGRDEHRNAFAALQKRKETVYLYIQDDLLQSREYTFIKDMIAREQVRAKHFAIRITPEIADAHVVLGFDRLQEITADQIFVQFSRDDYNLFLEQVIFLQFTFYNILLAGLTKKSGTIIDHPAYPLIHTLLENFGKFRDDVMQKISPEIIESVRKNHEYMRTAA